MIKKLIIYGLRKKKIVSLIYICLIIFGTFMVSLQFFRGDTTFFQGMFKTFMILFSVLQVLPIFMPIRISKYLFLIILWNLLVSGILFSQNIFITKPYFYLSLFLSICFLIDNCIFIIDKYADNIDNNYNEVKEKVLNISTVLTPLYKRNFVVKMVLIISSICFALINKDIFILVYVLFILGIISVSIEHFLLPSFLIYKLKAGYKKDKNIPLSKSLVYKLFFLQEKCLLFLFRKNNKILPVFMILFSCLIGVIFYNLYCEHEAYYLIPFIGVIAFIALFLFSIVKNSIIKIWGSCFIFNICGVLISLNISNIEFNIGGIMGIALLLSILGANMFYLSMLLKNKSSFKTNSFKNYRFGIKVNRIFFKPLFLTFCSFSIGLIPLLTDKDVTWKLFSLIVCFGSFLNIFALCFYTPLLCINNLSLKRYIKKTKFNY